MYGNVMLNIDIMGDGIICLKKEVLTIRKMVTGREQEKTKDTTNRYYAILRLCLKAMSASRMTATIFSFQKSRVPPFFWSYVVPFTDFTVALCAGKSPSSPSLPHYLSLQSPWWTNQVY